MGKKYDYDYIVIGSGPAGSTAALSLAKSKKRIGLVEGRFFGGTNLNTRDIPYAVALKYAHTFANISDLPGMVNQDISVSFPNIIADQYRAVVESGGNNSKIYENAGITCLKGYANFLNDHTIAIADKQYTAEYFILATGNRLKRTSISITPNLKIFTPETAIKIRRKPKAVFVVGGGSTGCEIAEYFAELGTKVLIAETAERLLPREDKEVGSTIANYFANHLGITVLTSSKVVALEEDEISQRVIFLNGSSEKMVRVDCIILATGSEPILEYGLENAKVKYKRSGIIVDKYFQTSSRHIFAIGDCIGGKSSTEIAEYEGTLLSTNLLNKAKSPTNYQGFARLTNTYPMVATVGLNEDELTKRDRKYKKAIINFSDTPASKILNLNYGFIKLLADKNNHLLGATIVSPDADLMTSEIAIVLRHNLTALELAATPHSTNSYNYIIKLAAKKILTAKK